MTYSQNGKHPVLRVAEVTKTFGAIEALKSVSFELHRGETVALVGDNGAGKSTLVGIIAGVHRPTSGQIFIGEELVEFHGPDDALDRGIETVYQDLALVQEHDTAENFYLGRELVRWPWLGPFSLVRKREMRNQARRAVEDLHIKIPGIEKQRIMHMSGGQRQAIVVARAAFWARELLLLDEPTAALGVEEAGEVLRIMVEIKEEQDIAQLMISHNLDHVFRVADRILILKQGEQVALLKRDESSPEEVVAYITGAKRPADQIDLQTA
jgi:ABC-type sugar transport system ATPase subunit